MWIKSCKPTLSPPAPRALALGLLLGLVSLSGSLTSHAANLPPKVSLVQPAQGESFTNPAEIQIAALAEDADGSIQSVELFTDLGSLGIVTPTPASASSVNPFQWTWKNPPAGDHKLVVQATDNEGLLGFSESLVISVKRDVSPSPATLTFAKPVDGEVFPWPGSVSIELVAVDPNGDIRHVEFFADGISIGRSDHWTKDAVVPGRPREHFLEWKPILPGIYQLSAQAVDTQGNPVASKPVVITVGADLAVVSIEATVWETREPAPNIRVRPGELTVRRTGPIGNPLTVFLKSEGSATPGVDYVALPEQITFLAGETEKSLLIEALEDGIPEGIETVAAVVFEPVSDRLPEYVVDPLHQAVKILLHDSFLDGPASLEITVPKDGEVFATGDTVTIHALATDPKGYIAQVEFDDFDKPIGTSRIDFIRAPDPGTPIDHTFEWKSPPPGDHVLTARAVDANGNPLVSKAVRIQVGTVSSLPTVQVTTLDAEAMELPPLVDAIDPARFSITRTGDLSKELDVVFSLHGTAERGKDYSDPGRLVRLAAGQSEAIVEIVPVADELSESMETVALRLEDPMPISSLPSPPTPYNMAPFGRTAVAVIFDRQRPEQGALEFSLPGSGEVYSQFEPIPLQLAAYHSKYDVSHVDFFANEKLIGSSDILFDKIQPGGLIVHRFDWKDPLPGDYVLTARAPLPDGTVLVAGKVQIQVQGSVQPAVVVEMASDDADAFEAAPDGVPDSAAFRIRRVGGPKDVAVTVYYTVEGTAQNGVDFELLDGKVSLPAGEESVPLVIQPIRDGVAEGDEVVVVTLVPPACPAIYPTPPWCYQIGPSSALKAVIHDGTPPTDDLPIAVSLLSPQPGAVFKPGETISFQAAARNFEASVNRLDIFIDDQLIESTKLSEVSFTRSDLALGTHVVEARAVDSNGLEVRSGPAKIAVSAGDTGGAVTQFRQVDRPVDGAIRLRLAGPVDRVCTLETSTDLVHWTELMPVKLPSGEFEFQDQVEHSRTQRFYRIR